MAHRSLPITNSEEYFKVKEALATQSVDRGSPISALPRILLAVLNLRSVSWFFELESVFYQDLQTICLLCDWFGSLMMQTLW